VPYAEQADPLQRHTECACYFSGHERLQETIASRRAGHVKTLAQETLRWTAIVAAGGYGVWQLIYAVRHILQWDGDWLGLMFVLTVYLTAASPFLAVAYICLRRRYRQLFVVLGVVGSLAIFVGLMALPDHLGIFEFMTWHEHENHDYAILGLPVGLLRLFCPIYAAAWFYGLCLRLAFPLPPGRERQRTQATRGLVWLGVLCLIVPPIIVGIAALGHVVQLPNAPIPAESIDNARHWIISLAVIGVLLVFLGLVRRQPIVRVPQRSIEPL
jgi:hypothetical protein